MSSQRKKSIVTHEDRKRIIEKSPSEISVKDISSLLGIKYSTIWAIVKQFNTTGSAIPKKRGGDKRSKLTYQFAEKQSTIMDQKCLLKLSDIVARIQREFNISVSKNTVERVLKEFHYTMKSVVTVPGKRNDDRTIRLRSEYANGFRFLETEFENSNFIFIDEVGFSVVTRPKRRHFFFQAQSQQISSYNEIL